MEKLIVVNKIKKATDADLLYNYKNGNCTISIYADGTKIRNWPDNEDPYEILPESIDVKVTNECDLLCPFCHELSVPNGQEADSDLFELFTELNPGTEIAIGGGNPLLWSELYNFLTLLNIHHIIANITINSGHIKKYRGSVEDLLDTNLITAMGISYNEEYKKEAYKLANNYPGRIIFHLINGVNDISDIYNIIDNVDQPKILILGYKDLGRGKTFLKNKNIVKKWTEAAINDLLNKNKNKYKKDYIISFDNLALTQLNIKNIVSDTTWNMFYMGDDGKYSMYIDLVKKEYAASSTSLNKYSMRNGDKKLTIKNIFNKIKNQS